MRQALLQDKETALNNAIASVEIEGYHISDYEKQLCMSVLNGNITKEDFIQTMLERCAV
ncbi:MAG: antitoxin VbhA family protein [Clostridia bacterium]|nr:antitoxin VbhA family protein [Clostridia bacterium]